jgi:phage shock protein A
MKILPTSLLTIALLAAGAVAVVKTREAGRLENARTAAEAKAADFASQAAAHERRTVEVRARLAEVDGHLSAARATLSETEARLAQHGRELAEQRNRVSLAEDNARRHEEAAEGLRKELAHVKLTAPPFTFAEFEALQARTDDAEARLAALTAAAVREPVRATVLRVGPADAFVVLDYGAERGGRVDQQLQVRRGEEIVATVRISEVHPQLSLALVDPRSLRSGLRTGDTALISPSP